MTQVLEDLAASLAAFLTRHHNARAVRIDGLWLLTGGAARQMFSFDATIEQVDTAAPKRCRSSCARLLGGI